MSKRSKFLGTKEDPQTYRDPSWTGTTDRYTAFVQWDKDEDTEEEIDVDAKSKAAARTLAQSVLDEGIEYQKGGKVVKIVGPRVGLYL